MAELSVSNIGCEDNQPDDCGCLMMAHQKSITESKMLSTVELESQIVEVMSDEEETHEKEE